MGSSRPIALTGIFLLMMVSTVSAQIGPFGYLPRDLTVSTPVGAGNSLIVGFDGRVPGTVNTFRNPTSPTISFVEPGQTSIPLYVYNASTLSSDHGIFNDVYMKDTSTLIMQNAAAARIVTLTQQSKFIFNGGAVETLLAANSSNVSMSNAQISDPDGNPSNSLAGLFSVSNSANATVTNGKIFGSAAAAAESNLSLLNSEVTGRVSASGDGIGSTVTIVSSSIGLEDAPGQIYAEGRGKIILTFSEVEGGAFAIGNAEITATTTIFRGHLTVTDDSSLALSGGFVFGDVVASGKATVVMTDLVDVKGTVSAADDANFLMGGGFANVATATGSSTLGIEGANLGYAKALGRGTVNLDSAFVDGDVFADQRGKINIDGDGRIDGFVFATGESRVTMNNGQVVGIVSSSGSDAMFTLTGGRIRDGQCSSFGKFNMSGGEIDQNLLVSADGTANLSGGRIGGDLNVGAGGKANMSGGHVAGAVRLNGMGEFVFSGGTFGTTSPPPPGGGSQQLLLADSLFGQGSGETIAPSLIANDSSSITLIGRNLAAALVDPNFEETFSVYELSGRLADGTSIGGLVMHIQNGTGASFQIVEVPEPSAVLLVSLAVWAGLFIRPWLIRR